MDSPLGGVQARLGRAKENIANLELKLADYGREHPEVFVTNRDADTGHEAYKVRQFHETPLWAPVLIGEVLFLLRSALDHLIAQILIPLHNPADIDKILERSIFPIHTEDITWKSFDWTKIPGVSTQIQTAITASQPCNRTDGLPIDDHPLAVLASLHNIDKHRLLLVLVTHVSVSGFTQVGGITSFSSDPITFTDAIIPRGQVDAELLRTDCTGRDMDMHVQTTAQVAFEQVGTRKGKPVIPTLENLHKAIAELIDNFRTNFF